MEDPRFPRLPPPPPKPKGDGPRGSAAKRFMEGFGAGLIAVLCFNLLLLGLSLVLPPLGHLDDKDFFLSYLLWWAHWPLLYLPILAGMFRRWGWHWILGLLASGLVLFVMTKIVKTAIIMSI